MTATVPDDEAFESSYLCYVQHLRVLATSPHSQCDAGSNHNVAWELKDEIESGVYLDGNPASHLSSEQTLAIEQLAESVRRLPQSVLVEALSAGANLAAMDHLSWKSLRKQAILVLRVLGEDA